MSNQLYAHFTSHEHAEAIAKSLTLLPCVYLATSDDRGIAYAVEIGVTYRVDSVQRHKSGRVTDGRDWAVVFIMDRAPDAVSPFGEEVEFFTADLDAPLTLVEALVVPADEVSVCLPAAPDDPEIDAWLDALDECRICGGEVPEETINGGGSICSHCDQALVY
jgi:hypothetical protein